MRCTSRSLPFFLGSGEYLLAGIDLNAAGFACTEHVASPAATHVVLTEADVAVRVAFATVVVLALYGCAARAEPKPALGAIFNLRYGERATISTERLSLTFQRCSKSLAAPSASPASGRERAHRRDGGAAAGRSLGARAEHEQPVPGRARRMRLQCGCAACVLPRSTAACWTLRGILPRSRSRGRSRRLSRLLVLPTRRLGIASMSALAIVLCDLLHELGHLAATRLPLGVKAQSISTIGVTTDGGSAVVAAADPRLTSSWRSAFASRWRSRSRRRGVTSRGSWERSISSTPAPTCSTRRSSVVATGPSCWGPRRPPFGDPLQASPAPRQYAGSVYAALVVLRRLVASRRRRRRERRHVLRDVLLGWRHRAHRRRDAEPGEPLAHPHVRRRDRIRRHGRIDGASLVAHGAVTLDESLRTGWAWSPPARSPWRRLPSAYSAPASSCRLAGALGGAAHEGLSRRRPAYFSWL